MAKGFSKHITQAVLATLLFAVPIPEAEGKIIRIRNAGEATRVLTDFISHDNAGDILFDNVFLFPNALRDDVTLAPGEERRFDIGDHERVTASWFNDDGDEIEIEALVSDLPETPVKVAMFCSSSEGRYSVSYDLSRATALPDIGETFSIDELGRLAGAKLDWITFYDVTESAGFVERDAFGNITSPLLPIGTEVSVLFQWSFSKVPEPRTVLLFALGCLVMVGGKRRFRERTYSAA